MSAQDYFNQLVKAAQKHTTETFKSVALAQALLESGLFSGNGPSGLALIYNNWFGIKDSPSWKGAVTPPLATKEDEGTGKMYTIHAGFRAYPNLEASVKDHNDLFKTAISQEIYAKVLSAKTPKEQTKYLQGTYATDSNYARLLNQMIDQYNLTQYDKKTTGGGNMVTAAQVISAAKKYNGANQYSSTHRAIVDKYNTQNPLPRGTRMLMEWDWCSVFVSVVLMDVGLSAKYGTEMSVEHYKTRFKNAGIWKGLVRPQVGDIVIFRWDGNKQGWADHIGFVSAVNGDNITTVEGNTVKGGVSTVGSNSFRWNVGAIQGYARPAYGNTLTTPSKPTPAPVKKMTFEQAVQAVIAGTFGNGKEREQNIVKVGQDHVKVQNEVNKRLKPKPTMTFEQAVQAVIAGKMGNGEIRKQNIAKVGQDHKAVQNEVDKRLKPKPKMTFEQAVKAVIAGTFGNGEVRKQNIIKVGQDHVKVQNEVNKLLKPTPKKSKDQVVREVIRGDYGNGQARRDKLTREGYNPDEIGRLVDRALG